MRPDGLEPHQQTQRPVRLTTSADVGLNLPNLGRAVCLGGWDTMSAQTIRLLLVEDNPKDARLVRNLLHKDHGTSIHQVDRIATATEHLAGHEIDVVLLNLGLADSQGLDTLRSVTKAAPRV